MSQPKRYNLRLPQITYGMEESKDGEYVYHSDYAALAAENERLRKAGDAMAGNLNDCPACTRNCQSEINAWLAAKEGRDAK